MKKNIPASLALSIAILVTAASAYSAELTPTSATALADEMLSSAKKHMRHDCKDGRDDKKKGKTDWEISLAPDRLKGRYDSVFIESTPCGKFVNIKGDKCPKDKARIGIHLLYAMRLFSAANGKYDLSKTFIWDSIKGIEEKCNFDSCHEYDHGDHHHDHHH